MQNDLLQKDSKSEKNINKNNDQVIRDDKTYNSEDTIIEEQYIDTALFTNDNEDNSLQQQKEQDLRVYDVAEDMPEFPGGVSALKSYLDDKVKVPSISAHLKKPVRAMISVIVEKDGTLSTPSILRSTGISSLDKEAVSIVLDMPLWKPALNDGEPVRMKYTVPVQFVPELNKK